MDDEENDMDNLFAEYEADDNETGDRENDVQDENEAVDIANPSAPAGTKVAAPKRAIKNPRLKFNADRLIGERGIPVVIDHFKNVKFKGKGHEEKDLDKLLSTLELWTHRLFPSMTFEDTLKQVEKLGHKRPVQTCLHKIRMDMPVQYSSNVIDEEDNVRRNEDFEPDIDPDDAFNQLLGQRNDSVPDDDDDDVLSEVIPAHNTYIGTPSTSGHVLGRSNDTDITEDQRKRMEYNRMLAAERRKASSSHSLNNSDAVTPKPGTSSNVSAYDEAIPSTSTDYLTVDELIPSTNNDHLTMDEPVPSRSNCRDHQLSLSPELNESVPIVQNYISPFTECSVVESEPRTQDFETNASLQPSSSSCNGLGSDTEEPMSISILNADEPEMSLKDKSSQETSSDIDSGVRDDPLTMNVEGESSNTGNSKDLSLDDILDIFDEDDDVPVKKKRLNRISSSEEEMSDDD